MGTMFHHEDGTHVATRWWGGTARGCVVQLERGAGDVTMDTPLQGSDGSRETLRTLADSWAGRRAPMGGHRTRAEVEPCSLCGEADRSKGEHGLNRCSPL